MAGRYVRSGARGASASACRRGAGWFVPGPAGPHRQGLIGCRTHTSTWAAAPADQGMGQGVHGRAHAIGDEPGSPLTQAVHLDYHPDREYHVFPPPAAGRGWLCSAPRSISTTPAPTLSPRPAPRTSPPRLARAPAAPPAKPADPAGREPPPPRVVPRTPPRQTLPARGGPPPPAPARGDPPSPRRTRRDDHDRPARPGIFPG